MTVHMEAARNYLVQLEQQVHEREDGQDMIEYSLLAALISISCIAIIVLVGPTLSSLFQHIVSALGSA